MNFQNVSPRARYRDPVGPCSQVIQRALTDGVTYKAKQLLDLGQIKIIKMDM